MTADGQFAGQPFTPALCTPSTSLCTSTCATINWTVKVSGMYAVSVASYLLTPGDVEPPATRLPRSTTLNCLTKEFVRVKAPSPLIHQNWMKWSWSLFDKEQGGLEEMRKKRCLSNFRSGLISMTWYFTTFAMASKYLGTKSLCQSYAIAIKFATRFKNQVFATLPGVPLSHLARKFFKSCQHQSHLPTVPSFAVSVT